MNALVSSVLFQQFKGPGWRRFDLIFTFKIPCSMLGEEGGEGGAGGMVQPNP